mmetsp:Transcript_7872/g.10186  ORF Transcript_7872/g.10186 Transcript_7872/m.10186 type:complete len:205 (+) Transcript_7872:111-725(+)
MDCDWFFYTGPDTIGNDTFLLRDVKGSDAWVLLTSLAHFGDWALGGNVEETGDWLTKKPYNLKATRCFMAAKQSRMYGRVMILVETIEEEIFKFYKSKYRIVTFTTDHTEKSVAIDTPTVEFINEFRILETVDGTTVNRRCHSYKNHGAMPIFIDQWLEEENTAMVAKWTRTPITSQKAAQEAPAPAPPPPSTLGTSSSFNSLF